MSALAENLKIKYDFINNVVEELEVDIHSILEIPYKYALKQGGKRLRPLICILCAEVMKGDYRKTRDAFVALELVHNGTLVHDDILDEDLFRRGSLSVHVNFGGKRAVLTGDVLLSLGLKFATKTGNLGIVNCLSDTALKMVQGVALQTHYRRKLVSEKEYFNIIYLKSGSLFEAAATLGCMVSSGDEKALRDLASFGKNFGIAYQIRDDVCGAYSPSYSDKNNRSDLLNGDLSLPFIYALQSESISDQDKTSLLQMYQGKKRIDDEEVMRIYEETGSLKKSITEIEKYAMKSRKSLNSFERSEAKNCINYLLDRYYKHFDPKKALKVESLHSK